MTSDPSLSPIFVVGSVWRSGTTALQRVINSTNQALIWGEPWDKTHRLHQFRFAFLELNKASDTSGSNLTNFASLESGWTALMQPSTDDFVSGVRSLYLTYFNSQVKSSGIPRWGFKEVHFDGADLEWLRTLFPEAQFIFVGRDPVDAWKSYLGAQIGYGHGWQQPGSSLPLTKSADFARLWTRRTKEISSFAKLNADKSLFLSYENLEFKKEETVREVLSFIGLNDEYFDRAMITANRKVGASSSRIENTFITKKEKSVFVGICHEEAVKHGYSLDNKVGGKSD